MKYTLQTHHRKLLVDTMTPVNMYLKVRDNFPNSILLESSDYGVNDNSVAYICFNPIADIKLQNQMLSMRYPDGKSKQIQLADNERVAKYCSDFAKQFAGNFKSERFVSNGLFGFTSYDAVQHFEDIQFSKKQEDVHIPQMHYALLQNVIAINVFNNEAHLYAHCYQTKSNLDEVVSVLQAPNPTTHSFSRQGKPKSNLTDDELSNLSKREFIIAIAGMYFRLCCHDAFPNHLLGMTLPYIVF